MKLYKRSTRNIEQRVRKSTPGIQKLEKVQPEILNEPFGKYIKLNIAYLRNINRKKKKDKQKI